MEARSAALRQVSFRAIGWLAVVAMLAVAVLGPSAPRTLGVEETEPNYEFGTPGITVDGNRDDWTGADFYADMWRAGDEDKPNPVLESKLYLRYNCDDGMLYVMVETEEGVTLAADGDNFVKIDGDKKVGSPNVGNYVESGDDMGWEASFALAEGTYDLDVHTQVEDEGSQTSAVDDRSIPLTIDCPEETPSSAPPSAPPSEEPSAPPSEEPEPNEALVWVVKVLDLDGDLDTEDDQSPAEGWEFAYDSDGGTIVDSETTTDADGTAWLAVAFDGDSTDVSITETLQTDFEFIDAYCIDLGDIDSEPGDEDFPLADFTTEDLTVSLDVAAQTQYECVFFNTSGGVEEATGTPVITAGPTLPPTDLEGNAAPLSDTWRMALIALAGILASVLVMTPARSTRRR